jgi:hypothetical protein
MFRKKMHTGGGISLSGYPIYCLDVPKNCGLAYRVDLKRMTSRLAATAGLAAQPAQHITVHRCCYITAASQNSDRTTQQMWHR